MEKVLLLLAMLSIFGLSGCETMEGFGRDLQTLGDAIEDSASDED